MIKALENMQTGFETPQSFQDSVVNHRIVNLAPSQSRLDRFHTGAVNALDVDKVDERYLISGAKDGAVCIHDLQNSTGKASYTAKLVCEIPKHSRYSHKYSVETVQWYPFDTGMFHTSGMDEKLKIWDTNAMRPAETFNLEHRINCHHMSPIATNHSLIAIAMDHPHVVLVDPKSGSYCHQLRAHKESVQCLRWSPVDEYLLATGGIDSKILLWDIRSAKGCLCVLDQDNGEARGSLKDLITSHSGRVVNGLRFTDDGLYLVSSGTDSRLRLWDVALSTNTLVNFGAITSSNHFRQCCMDICCNTNPPVLFIPFMSRVIGLDLFSGSRIVTLVGHFNIVNCCLYLPSTNQVVSGGKDMNILLWTPDTRQEVNEAGESSDTDEPGQAPPNADAWSSDEESK